MSLDSHADMKINCFFGFGVNWRDLNTVRVRRHRYTHTYTQHLLYSTSTTSVDVLMSGNVEVFSLSHTYTRAHTHIAFLLFFFCMSFIECLSHLVDDVKYSITALYHCLYGCRLPWLYVFLMVTLGGIWNEISETLARQGDLLCRKPTFIRVACIVKPVMILMER